ncbi:peptidoglycan-binding protein [Streptomyces lincolnensis]|uniref:peptidoglycan-binding domain-containing protein n=1 Tax=Streptomyces lincolnensis TaxID=1915 RepID=UPI001E58A412|nr:peptidoglycan-binding protein [Streptomyces lincolnensis]MCD7445231.1 peptidoglycan-binding protein [Streptomyces lincolnensis]
MSATPASANVSDGYVSGAGNLFDGWDDEGTVSRYSHASSHAVCLWQQVLNVEDYGHRCEIDGIFGPTTETRTKPLQSRWGLTADGIVGEDTWSKAGESLGYGQLVNDGPHRHYRMRYTGATDDFVLYRGETGRHGFYELANENWRVASYNSRTCN